MKIHSRLIYLIFICLMIGVFFIFYLRYRMELQTVRSGEVVGVRILKVVCAGSNENQNYFVFRGTNSNHIVNVGNQYCNNYHVGDSVNVLHNKEYDLYFTMSIDTSDSKWGMIFPALLMLITMLYLLFPKVFKK